VEEADADRGDPALAEPPGHRHRPGLVERAQLGAAVVEPAADRTDEVGRHDARRLHPEVAVAVAVGHALAGDLEQVLEPLGGDEAMPPTSPVSSWLVATVVPWLTEARVGRAGAQCPERLADAGEEPSAGSAGVDGVLTASSSPESSSTATTSVNVPPVSMPTLIRLTSSVSLPGRGWGRQTLTIAPDRSGKITRTVTIWRRSPYNSSPTRDVYIAAMTTGPSPRSR
jgi:hypothetical protein